MVFLGFARHGWSPSDPDHERQRMHLLRDYEDWLSRFKPLFATATPRVEKRIEEADGLVRRWLRHDQDDHSVPATTSAAVDKARDAVSELRALIDLACGPADMAPVVAVTDTNALIDNSNLASYSTSLGVDSFEVRLVPTVLGEIDELKRGHRSEQVRAAAQKADRMMKESRRRGDPLLGIPIEGAIRLRFQAREPVFDPLPGWLDPRVPDDRLAAAALTVQFEAPNSAVVLVSSDINLQTKAAALGLPHVEPPAPS